MRSPGQRTVDAVARARAERHQARLDGHVMRVKSHTRPGVTYRVRVGAALDVVTFTCDHVCYRDDGTPIAGARPTWTTVPCKHGARVAMRLQRHGLLRWDSDRWAVTEKAYRLGFMPRPVDDDPFAGLPGC